MDRFFEIINPVGLVLLLVVVAYLVFRRRKPQEIPAAKNPANEVPTEAYRITNTCYQHHGKLVSWHERYRVLHNPKTHERPSVITDIECAYDNDSVWLINEGELTTNHDFWSKKKIFFIEQKLEGKQRLYVVHPDDPMEAQLIAESTVEQPHKYYALESVHQPADSASDFYESMPLLVYLRNNTGGHLHRLLFTDGKARLEPITNHKLEALYSMPLRDAIEWMQDLPDEQEIISWTIHEGKTELAVAFSVKDVSQAKPSISEYIFVLTHDSYRIQASTGLTFGQLVNDPTLIERLRLPSDPDRDPEEDAFFEKLSELVEKNPVHTPGLRRG